MSDKIDLEFMKKFWKFYRILKISLAVLVGVILLSVATIYALSSYRLNRTHEVPPLPELTLSADPAVLARGGHFATSIGKCTECHGGDLGGAIVADVGLLGTVAAPNLTTGRGGVGAWFTEADWVRALRQGVHRDGTSLLVMPSQALTHLREDDLVALVSYLKQLPPIDREVPPSELRIVGRAMLLLGQLNILTAEHLPKSPIPLLKTIDHRPTRAYGAYLAVVGGCQSCHGEDLSGGEVHGPPGTPPTANLTPAGIGTWTEADFVRALRTGVRPNGKNLHPSMPWRQAGLMTDDELHALWLYVRSVPPRETVRQ